MAAVEQNQAPTDAKIFSGTATEHNENDLKHSRVCHASLFATPLIIGVYAMCICVFENSYLAVFSQFRY